MQAAAEPGRTSAVSPSDAVRTYADEDQVSTQHAREGKENFSEAPAQTGTEALSGPLTPVKEIIFALSSTMEGDTTTFYLTKRLKPFRVKVSTIARGVPVGGDLEYADEITLGRSIVGRVRYE
ncbi:MAG: toprim domain-containing protein [Ferruginibacter sp.]|nr:toprim domain-containing protein [Cytophagales bacterium]